jgi:lysosomal alpha-glucosidase
MLNFNMFGIPLVGADICGFNGNTTVELCQRWQELGAFYPFSRNHNSLGMIDQDPAAFSEAFIASSRMALLVRYQLLPLYYTLFFRAALNGTTVVRPLFFEFPNDRTTYQIDWQFLIGESLMVSPVLSANTTHLLAYFPKARWYVLFFSIDGYYFFKLYLAATVPLDCFIKTDFFLKLK